MKKVKIFALSILLISSIVLSIGCTDKNKSFKEFEFLKINKSKKNVLEEVKLDSSYGKLRLFHVPFVYNSLYRLENVNDKNNSIKILKNFEYLVCAEPDELVKDELFVADNIKSEVKIFGYVSMGKPGTDNLFKSMDILKNQVDNIYSNDWYGVFIDQYGYDFGETRQRQNEIVSYIHEKGLKCFVNCWFIDDAFGNSIHEEHNKNGEKTELKKDDWYLMESFLMNGSGYLNINDLLEKCAKAQLYKKEFDIKIIALTYKKKDTSWDDSSKDVENSYNLSLLMGFDGWWFTDYLESDNFFYGKIPKLNYGENLLRSMEKDENDEYTAVTNEYHIKYDFNDYPNLISKVYKYVKK